MFLFDGSYGSINTPATSVKSINTTRDEMMLNNAPLWNRDVKILEDYHSGYHQSETIENIKNDHEPQKIDNEVEIFVKNEKEDVTSDEIFGEQEIFDEGEIEDIISGEMHTYNEGEKKDENSNSKKNKKMENCKGGDTIKLRRSERNNKGKPPNNLQKIKKSKRF
ncbi:hypothetical protein JTB14_022627 [Gonioctena quinquepunctata]|nr:hypothetical protein JTB14_022627 [Gonioctena quinquepunctata]